jgi:hypothetical protein
MSSETELPPCIFCKRTEGAGETCCAMTQVVGPVYELHAAAVQLWEGLEAERRRFEGMREIWEMSEREVARLIAERDASRASEQKLREDLEKLAAKWKRDAAHLPFGTEKETIAMFRLARELEAALAPSTAEKELIVLPHDVVDSAYNRMVAAYEGKPPEPAGGGDSQVIGAALARDWNNPPKERDSKTKRELVDGIRGLEVTIGAQRNRIAELEAEIFELQKWKALASKLGSRAEKAEAQILTLGAALTKLTADRDRDLKRAGEDVERLQRLLKRLVADVELPKRYVKEIDAELGYEDQPEPDGAA